MEAVQRWGQARLGRVRAKPSEYLERNLTQDLRTVTQYASTHGVWAPCSVPPQAVHRWERHGSRCGGGTHLPPQYYGQLRQEDYRFKHSLGNKTS